MTQMTHRERVLAAVDHQETDRTPLDFGGTLATSIVPSAYEKLKHHLSETHPTTNGLASRAMHCKRLGIYWTLFFGATTPVCNKHPCSGHSTLPTW